MKKIIVIACIVLVFLNGCSGVPGKLKKTAHKQMIVFMAQNSNITEANLYDEPFIIDQLQLTEDQWCLTYEIGHLLWFSTLWEKQEKQWIQTEIRPYVDHCNWARY